MTAPHTCHGIVVSSFDPRCPACKAKDEEKTSAHTPSAMLRLGIETCPACEGRGLSLVLEVCFFCEGGCKVSNEKAAQWRAAHAKTDPHLEAVNEEKKDGQA